MTSTCYSGGAAGADTFFGICAANAGHRVIHYTFSGHGIKAKRNNGVIHRKSTQEELNEADPHLVIANKTLKRGKFPYDKEYTNNLLRRNYWQIRETTLVYAVAGIDFDKNQVFGGTSWAVQMHLDMTTPCTDIFEQYPVYVFDQDKNQWFWVDMGYRFVPIDPQNIIKPFGRYTGIGTRDLRSNGEAAIRFLYSK